MTAPDSSQYPNNLDEATQYVGDSTDLLDGSTTPDTEHVNHHLLLADAVEKIESTLGTNPQGGAASVKNRMTAAEAATTAHTSQTTAAHGGIVANTDPRLSDARTPTAHKSTHATSGSDPLTAADIGAAPAAHNHAGVYDPAGSASAAQAGAQAYAVSLVDDLSGVSNPSQARTNLGLGNAATRNVGTGSANVAAGNDSRFTNARTPLPHKSTHATGGSDPITPADIGAASAGHLHNGVYDTAGSAAAAQATAQNYAAGLVDDLSGVTDPATARGNLGLGNSATRNVGTSSTTVAAGNDSRFTDARTPIAHKATHATGGTDAIAAADIGAATAVHTHDASAITGGTINAARLGSGTANASTYLRGDQTWAALSGTGDVVGPGSAVDGRAALFDGTTGKLLKQSSAAPVLEGDGRLSDARTPTTHKSSHATGGADALTPGDIGAEAAANKGVANGYASLDANGLLPDAQLPPLAVSNTYIVASEAAMLALTAEPGDLAVRTDIVRTFVLQGNDPTDVNDWVAIIALNETFLYNSSGAQSGHRFNDWADLMVAVAAIDGPWSITFEQNETIPAGTWDISGGTLKGNGISASTGGGVFLTLPTGCYFTSTTGVLIDEGLGLLQDGSTTPFEFGLTLGQFIIGTGGATATISATATAPLFNVAVGNQGILGLAGGGQLTLGGGGTLEPLNIDGTCYYAAGSQSITGSDVISGSGQQILLIQEASTNYSFTQTNLANPPFTLYFTYAQSVGYVPTNGGDWTTSPATVLAALDELAARQPVDAAFTPTTGGDWTTAPTTIQEALDEVAARLTAGGL